VLDEFGAAWVKVSIAKLGILKDVGLVGVTVERRKT
jgi:dihydroneopterin aldolase